MLIINYLFLLFGLQLTKSTSFWIKFFLIINWINLIVTFILTLTSCIFIASTANQLIILITIFFNCVSQLYLHYHKDSLIKLQSDIISNISSKSIKSLKRIAIVLTFLILFLITIDTIKSTLLLISIGSLSYTINFHPWLIPMINSIYSQSTSSSTESENDSENFDNYQIKSLWFILLIVINLHSTITQLSWFLISLDGYIHFYLSLNYLNQSLHNYTKRMFIKYNKIGDLSSLIYAHRKVYNMKVKFDSIVAIIPFIWWLNLFIAINITLGDLLTVADREIETIAKHILPTLGLILIVLICFTLIVVIYKSKDRETINRITRLVCIETTRSESIEKLIAFLTEIQLFPTINLTLAHWIPFNCNVIIVFILLTFNCIALWLILTPYGRVIIGYNYN